MDTLDLNAFVGAETGLLKGINVNPKANIVKNFHTFKDKKLDKEEEVTAMAWDADGAIIMGLRNRHVKVWEKTSIVKNMP